MKKKRFLTFAVLFATVMSFTGCGTALYELTESEEAIIANYSAYVISKYNTFQRDGMNSVVPDIKENDTETLDNVDTDGETASGTEMTDSAEQGEQALSLVQALELPEGIDVAYNGFTLAPSYKEENYYALEAESGYTYLIMNFTLTNSGEEACDLDLFSMSPKFSVQIDAGDKISAESNFLTYSLANYEGTIQAGDSVNVVLLFQVADTTDESSVNPELYIDKQDNTYSVNLQN